MLSESSGWRKRSSTTLKVEVHGNSFALAAVEITLDMVNQNIPAPPMSDGIAGVPKANVGGR